MYLKFNFRNISLNSFFDLSPSCWGYFWFCFCQISVKKHPPPSCPSLKALAKARRALAKGLEACKHCILFLHGTFLANKVVTIWIWSSQTEWAEGELRGDKVLAMPPPKKKRRRSRLSMTLGLGHKSQLTPNRLVPTLGLKMPVSKLSYAKRSYKILWK